MNSATGTAAPASSRFGAFALVFGISFAILYTVCDMAALPMFTYHPGTDRIDPGFAPPRRDEGPAMYWYGWIANSTLGASIFGLLATLLPENIRSRIDDDFGTGCHGNLQASDKSVGPGMQGRLFTVRLAA